MARQYCPECGSEVPVDEETGVCHVGHPVPASADAAPGPTTFPIGADDDPPSDEPAPWVATVADDDATAEPRREPDPAATPPPGTVTGSASPPPAGVGEPDVEVHIPGADQSDAGADATTTPPTAGAVEEPEPFRFAGTPEAEGDGAAGHDPAGDDQGPGDDHASLEELAAMAATSGADSGGDDLAGLSDDLRADLGSGGASHDDEFDLDSLEAAVADLGGQTGGQPATPEMAPEAPGPDAAPDPATAVAEVPGSSDQPGLSEGPSEEDDDLRTTGIWDDDAVSIRPDHDTGDAGSSDPLDPTNFTASGRRVSAPSAGGGGGGLVDKLKGLFGR